MCMCCIYQSPCTNDANTLLVDVLALRCKMIMMIIVIMVYDYHDDNDQNEEQKWYR